MQLSLKGIITTPCFVVNTLKSPFFYKYSIILLSPSTLGLNDLAAPGSKPSGLRATLLSEAKVEADLQLPPPRLLTGEGNSEVAVETSLGAMELEGRRWRLGGQ